MTFGEFVRHHGKRLVRGVVAFGRNEEAAREFERAAEEAGFSVIIGCGQSGWIYRNANTQLEWTVSVVE